VTIEEISSGIVCFRRTQDQKIEVLLLNHGKHVSHPKGHVEKKESLQQTAIRELKEETNLELLIISIDPIVRIEYDFRRNNTQVNKQVHYFAGFVKPKQHVLLSDEHLSYEWSSLRGGIAKLTYANDKYALRLARKWIKSDYETPIIMARNLALLR
jgi:8-oxo-dGTP pyrophosphatase MutT (NUDIX family)